MNIIPAVKALSKKEGNLFINSIEAITFPLNESHYVRCAFALQKNISGNAGIKLPIVCGKEPNGNLIRLKYLKGSQRDESYTLKITPDGIDITGNSPVALFRGVYTFIQIQRLSGALIPLLEIDDSPDFAFRGFYHDVTRGKVPTLATLKTLVDRLAFYKINQLQLYVEHTFAFRSIPELWVDRDPLTAEEILELDAYCREHYIDLVPSLSTFGHLYELLRLKRFEHLNELEINASERPHNLWERMAHYTIDAGSDEGFNIVRTMIEEYLPLFSSQYFNICCDETFDLGKGKNRLRAEKEGVGRVYVDFVKKIMNLVTAHGKTPMLWGDIVLKYPHLISELSSEAIFLNWDYSPDVTDESVKIFRAQEVKQYVCPGVIGWSRFMNKISDASENIRRMIRYGKENQAIGVLNTDWGDCGHVNLLANSLSGMAFGAALSWNVDSFREELIFDQQFSVLEWGESQIETASLLRKLGDVYPYHFGNIYAWVKDLKGHWNIDQDIRETEEKIIEGYYIAATEISQKLKLLKSQMAQKPICHIEFDEFIWSAEAVAWTNLLLLFKKKFEFKQNVSLGTVSPQEIIERGYKLLSVYQVIWRRRNKESELRNVVSAFRLALEKMERIIRG
ncbi:beta-N-acetylhexosaminidase [Chitinispirillum alkaliphilum]|nr:beta-N-acetylhexosaminidase [Chitinispirillum alkaliphilum]